MKTRRLPAIIMLIAGLITCIITIIKKFEVIDALTTLLMVLLSFYVIGVFVRIAVDKIININNKEETAMDSSEDSEADEEKTTQNE